ncbi:GntR family transcriptional regulator [Streptomyces goshikiensis]|uniref:GntR family transcriptional regulator n=1 Tax=Streptomyces goshikiensis TaxID=1942 RepID=UPI0036614B58
MSDETLQPTTRVIRAIEDQIRAGRLKAHGQLPAIREIGAELGVGYNTVQAGLKDLRTRGLVYSHKGKGSFVTEDALAILSGSAPPSTLQARVEHLEGRVEDLERTLAEVLERLGGADGSAGQSSSPMFDADGRA